MKKIIVLIFAIMLASTASMAQTRLGLRGGLSIASSSAGKVGDSKSTSVLGFNGGVVVETYLSKYVSLQPEVLFDQRGIRYENETNGNIVSYRPNYLSIPIYLKATFPIDDKLRGNVHIGPYLGYSVGGKGEIVTSSGTVTADIIGVNRYDQDEFDKPQVSMFDYGVNFGVGASYDIMDKVALFADVRYSLALVELQKYPSAAKELTSEDGKKFYEATSRAVQITTGVSFKIGE